MTTTPNTPVRKQAIIMAASLLAWMLLLVSCDQPTEATPAAYLPFTMQETEGNATFETPRFTVVFEGEEFPGSMSSELLIAGSTLTYDGTMGELKINYENGVCTVTFRTYTLMLTNEATRATINGTEIEDFDVKSIITVKTNGSFTTEDK